MRFFRPLLLGLVILLAASMGAFAGTVNYSMFEFLTPMLQFGSTTDVQESVSNTEQGYSFSGEFCANEGCSTGAISTSATSLLRFTNMTLTCINSSTCGPIDIIFEAQGGSAPSGPTLLAVNLIGGGTASGFAQVCIQDSSHICSATLQGQQATNFPFFGTILGSSLGSFQSSGSFDVLGDFHIDSLGSGSSVTLANSFDIGITSLNNSTAPEPAAIFLFPAGLAGLALLRKYRTIR